MPAGNLFKLIVPVDAEGLRFDRPSDQVLWRKLTNVIMRDGFIETRPGLAAVGPRFQDLTNHPSPIVSLEESTQWQNVGVAFTAGGGTGSPQERLASDSDTGGAWTGTFADVDESPPNNGVTSLVATARDDTVRIGFVNPTNTYDIIDSVFLYIRARAPTGGLNTLEVAYGGRAASPTTAANKLADLVLSNTPYEDEFTENANPGWMDFFIPVPNSVPSVAGATVLWKQSLLNSFTVDLTLRTFEQDTTSMLSPSATGNDNDFLPATGEAWKRTDGILDAPLSWFADKGSTVQGTAGDRLSITFSNLPNPTDLTSIIDIIPRFAINTPDGAPATVLIYHRGTDAVRRTVLTATRVTHVNPDSNNTPFPFAGWQLLGAGNALTTNPETSAAWTLAELQAGLEFGIEVVTGTVNFTSADVWYHGLTTAANAEIDNIRLFVNGREFIGASGTAGDTPAQLVGRVMATGTGFQRLVNEYPDGTSEVDSFEDISAGVSLPKRNMQPLESAIFFDRVYWQNGAEAPFFFEGATISQLSSTTPIGKTIWSFGSRLMQGDVTNATTEVRSTKRVVWSGIAGPDEWTAADSGSLDLTDGGEGRLRKGLALSSQMAALYLDKGIYNLRWTGDSAAPFSPRIQDADTGVIAPATVKTVMDTQGTAVHMFLGRGPQGINIYAYEGTQAQAIGQDIKAELNRVFRAGKAEWAFAGVEPRLNLYLLFLPEAGQYWPSQCWAYSIDSNSWTRWEFPFDITASGSWSLFGLTRPRGSGSVPVAPVDGITAVKNMVMGTSVGIPYKWDFDVASDQLVPRTDDNTVALTDFYSPDSAAGSQQEQGIAWDIQTGDLVISQNDIIRQTAIKRIWITYEDRGFVDIEFSESVDSGDNYINVVNVRLGAEGSSNIAETDEQELKVGIIDFPLPQASRQHRIRMRPNQTALEETNARQKLKFSKLVIEYEDLGEAP